MRNHTKGFTLIELMIVVAIIGVLSSIAIPAYQTHIAKTETSSVLATLSSLKTVVETETLMKGTFPSSVSDLGVSPSAAIGTLSLAPLSGTAGAGKIIMEFVYATPQNKTKKMALQRDGEGSWKCIATHAVSDKDLLPKSCTAAQTIP
ncbi:pilin [Vibrio gelatinilyticus]|uniref:pilin n=1 Tax=Vibrio gelatinilyticus TaxID=2893468 RepID=UPI002445952E|nr:pilin [Vibrio gelatinilyticus]